MLFNFALNLTFQFLPIYNRKLGASEKEMGLLTAIQNVFSSLFSPFWGNASDKRGRKPFLMLGGLTMLVSGVQIAIANSPSQVIFAVAINAVGMSIFIPSWNGAIADYTENKSRGGFVGRISGVGSAYVTGALILFTILAPRLSSDEVTQFRLIMWISAINFGLIIVIASRYIDIIQNDVNLPKYSIFEPLRDKIFRRFLIVILFWWTWMSLAWSYFPIVVNDIVEADIAQVAWISIVGTVSQTIFAYKFGGYIDKIGIKKSMIIGFIPFSIVPFFFAFATEWWHLIIPQLIAGMGIGFGFTAMQTYIYEVAKNERAGTYQGTYQIFWGFVTFIGSYLGGFILSFLKDYFGSLQKATMIALIGISVTRIISNIFMILYIPDISKTE